MPRNSRARNMSEQDHAGQPAYRWKQSERPFRKAEQPDDRELDPEKENGADLRIVERSQQVAIAAIEKVDRQECLIVPDRINDQVPHQAHQQAQHDKRPDRPFEPASAFVVPAACRPRRSVLARTTTGRGAARGAFGGSGTTFVARAQLFCRRLFDSFGPVLPSRPPTRAINRPRSPWPSACPL